MKIRNILFAIFVALEAVLYCIIFSPLPNSYIYCYISIVLCFLFTLVLFAKNKSRLLVCLALLFTLVADTFLILLEGAHKAAAMAVFNFAQIAYAVKIGFDSKREVNIVSAVVRVALIVFSELLAFVILKLEFDMLIFVTLSYFVNIVLNVAFVFAAKPKNLLFIIGLILFLLCDINVGLPYLTDLFVIGADSLLQQYLNIHFNFIWFFYLPSQVCIVASLLKDANKVSLRSLQTTEKRIGE